MGQVYLSLQWFPIYSHKTESLLQLDIKLNSSIAGLSNNSGPAADIRCKTHTGKQHYV